MKRILPFSMILLFLSSILYPAKPVLTINSPNGGEKLKTGTVFPIEWTYSDSSSEPGHMVLILYRDGIKYLTISESAPNSGRFLWTISKEIPDSVRYRIRIRLKEDLSVNDFSNTDFSILSD